MEAAQMALEVKLNWLRAAVLGANDGIVSIAGVVIGVASAGADRGTILLSGIAAVVAGAVSMGGGEYTSVSAQRDTELAHGKNPKNTAAHPWQAAFSSFVAFSAGAALPMLAVIGPWDDYRVEVTSAAVVIALATTGFWAARVGNAPVGKSVMRNVFVSLVTVGLSYGIGSLLGVAVL
jgi:VIT1/CCC1 family predicted Fe2+/Mn2+ transporter